MPLVIIVAILFIVIIFVVLIKILKSETLDKCLDLNQKTTKDICEESKKVVDKISERETENIKQKERIEKDNELINSLRKEFGAKFGSKNEDNEVN